MINGQWEPVRDIDDVCRIVEENISTEFARKVREIFDVSNECDELRWEISDLEDEIRGFENDLDEKENECENLESVIEKLKDALDDAAYEVVSHKHPNCYDFSGYKREYISELASTYKISAEYVPN